MRHFLSIVKSLLPICILLVNCRTNEGPSTISYPDGGYDYPNTGASFDTNDYSYPIRNMISTKDSFNIAYYEHFWEQGYNEPNLSIRPQGTDIFRLTYKITFGVGAIFTLTPTEIIVKIHKAGNPFPEYDSTRLTSIERYHYNILYWNFPFREAIPRRRRSLDSLAKICPQLLNPLYYKELLDKSLIPNKHPLKYLTKKVSISNNKYRSLVNLINASGYWKMLYDVKCNLPIDDGFSYWLEANTKYKYNIVLRSNCPKDTTTFTRACQEIINTAHLDKPIKILNE